ncbi:MAG: tetratricopeptide repeat protein [Clostridia bacterium]|nr:tetratricopeptide repeat protein [Clostridia bacterium]
MKKVASRQQQKPKPLQKKSNRNWLWLALILLLTVLVYANAVDNDFIYQFDDDLYVTDNPDIKALTADNLYRMFTTSYVGLYLPLTMLTYAVEYHFFGLDATAYHLTNLLLHLINVWLVFLLIIKIKPNTYVAALVALVFALHPMHVESVAWISERKDVLYLLFYLAAAIFYLKYIRKNSAGNYLITLGFFVLSLLSKTIAVSLPLLLLALDWYFGRSLASRRVWIEKIPFFALSAAIGLLGIWFTSSAADTTTPDISWLHRPFIGADAVLMYLWKFLVPIQLKIYHYYPPTASGVLPLRFYVSAAILLSLLVAVILLIKKSGNLKRDLILGLAIFVVPTLFVLQIIPAGRAYAADRYTYFSYVGLAYMLAVSSWQIISTQKVSLRKWRTPLIIVMALWLMALGAITQQRNTDWSDSITLFTDLIQKDPDHGHPYLIRGITWYQQGKMELALTDYNQSILRDTTDAKAFANRASVRGIKGDYAGALRDANRALRIEPGYASAINNRATANFYLENYKQAVADYDALIAMDSSDAGNYRKKMMVLEKMADTAALIDSYQHLMRLEPDNYFNSAKAGELYYYQNKLETAIGYFDEALRRDASQHVLLMLRANALFGVQRFEEALKDYARYAEITGDANAWYNAGQCCLKLERIEAACEYWRKASEKNFAPALNRIKEFCR